MNRIEEMFKAGAHYGYSKSRRHPSTSNFVFMTKNGVDIINLEKTDESLEKTLSFVSSLAKEGKNIIFVGTKPEAKQKIAEVALPMGMAYVTERWVGGTLTNFTEVKRRINRLVELREQKEKGEFDKYTKKERLMIDREIESMTKKFDGLTKLSKTPDAMFVVDPKKEYIAVTEAKSIGIPVIALLNTDCDLKKVDYGVIANDGSLSSISFFLDKVKEAYDQK